MDDLLGGGSSADTGSGSGSILPEGYYPELRLVKCKVAKGKKSPYARYCSVDLEVLVPANGAEAGQHGDFYEQLELNKFPEHDKEGRGRVMKFLGALFGYGTTALIDQHINGQTLVLVSSDFQPETGKVVAGYCKHIVREGKKTIVRWDFSPCLGADGKPRVVRGKEGPAPTSVQSAIPAATPANQYVPGQPSSMLHTTYTAPAPAAFMPPPAPVAPPAAPAIPPGWAVHPADARFIYELQHPANMKQVG